jgi:putative transposase
MTFTRRHLPHWYPSGAAAFITWRLHGSLPPNIRPLRGAISSGKEFIRRDDLLDHAEHGPQWLKEPGVAAFVLSQLQNLHQRNFFKLHAFVLMANHVHILIEPKVPLAKITQQVKGSTAREANQLLARTGCPFWQDESFDHWVRNPGEWQKIRTYIEGNSVKAGLVEKPENWLWSSASSPIGSQ